MSAPDLADRFAGCLLGLACGDAFAAPFEGVPDYMLSKLEDGDRGRTHIRDLAAKLAKRVIG